MFRKLSIRFAPFALAATALIVFAASANAQGNCRRVHGHYEEHAVAPTCGSPVNLCIEGQFFGNLKGAFASTATALQPTGDFTTTQVVWFSGDGVIHAQMGGKQGDINFKSAGAFQTTGDGNIVDLQYITGGTGDFSGISGVIRASGTFDPVAGAGASDYEGMVCLP